MNLPEGWEAKEYTFENDPDTIYKGAEGFSRLEVTHNDKNLFLITAYPYLPESEVCDLFPKFPDFDEYQYNQAKAVTEEKYSKLLDKPYSFQEKEIKDFEEFTVLGTLARRVGGTFYFGFKTNTGNYISKPLCITNSLNVNINQIYKLSGKELDSYKLSIDSEIPESDLVILADALQSIKPVEISKSFTTRNSFTSAHFDFSFEYSPAIGTIAANLYPDHEVITFDRFNLTLEVVSQSLIEKKTCDLEGGETLQFKSKNGNPIDLCVSEKDGLFDVLGVLTAGESKLGNFALKFSAERLPETLLRSLQDNLEILTSTLHFSNKTKTQIVFEQPKMSFALPVGFKLSYSGLGDSFRIEPFTELCMNDPAWTFYFEKIEGNLPLLDKYIAFKLPSVYGDPSNELKQVFIDEAKRENIFEIFKLDNLELFTLGSAGIGNLYNLFINHPEGIVHISYDNLVPEGGWPAGITCSNEDGRMSIFKTLLNSISFD